MISDVKPFLVGCHVCSLALTVDSDSGAHRAVCPRCGAALHRRKPDSLSRTAALLIAACVLYIPANTLPIMLTTSFGYTRADTIISGVIYLMQSGTWPLALIVLFASVLVPLLKIAILLYLVISVRLKSSWRPVDRTRLYRITEAIGRWSMVDIFVVTIMVSLIQLGSVATIRAGTGALFFAAVVMITMLAAMSFDPRLIWDAVEENNDSN
jgi:paraquat-inducible protein A